MKRPRFKTQWNAHLFRDIEHGEINNLPSMTIPDEALTVTEILERHTRGIPFQAGRVPIYDGDEPKPDLKKMDISEIHDMIKANNEVIQDIKEKHNEKRSKKAAAEKKELEELRQQKLNDITNSLPQQPNKGATQQTILQE